MSQCITAMLHRLVTTNNLAVSFGLFGADHQAYITILRAPVSWRISCLHWYMLTRLLIFQHRSGLRLASPPSHQPLD